MDVKGDIIESGELVQTRDGLTVRRLFEVTALTGAPSAMVGAALSDPRIPRRGTPHPTIPGMIADEIAVQTVGPFAVRITVNYISYTIATKFRREEPGQDPQGTIRYNYGTSRAVTQFDRDGRQISLTHTYERTDTDGNVIRTTETQGVEIEIEVPIGGFEIQREETRYRRELADRFRGTVNKSRIWGYAPRTLLCTGIPGESTNGGQSWTVSYLFEYRRETWDATVAFIGPDGVPAPGLIEGEGVKTVRAYPETDFRELGLIVPEG